MYMSADLMKEIAKQEPGSARETLSSLIEMAKKEVGADHEYRPMYPGFPEQVMNMEDARFFYNALIYYMTGFPPYESVMYEDDELLSERDRIEYTCENLKCVGLADAGDIEKIYENLVTAPQVLSEKDVETVMQIVTETPEILRKDVDIRNKETLCLLASRSADELHVPIRNNAFFRMLRTPTDVARFIAVRSGNNASLTDAKFENKPGKERRLYAELFNRCNGNEEDIRKREGLFKMLFRKYHLPSLMDDRMKKVADDLYHGSYSEKTFESQREALKEAGDTDGLLKLYEKRPGMLAADMTGLIRYGKNIPEFEDKLTEVFREKAPEISANALMNLYRAVNYYEKERDHAIYAPKKGCTDPFVKRMERNGSAPISKETGNEIRKIICETLSDRAAKLPSLGTVYIDPALKDIPVPSNSSLRNINKDVVTLPFGSKIPLSLPETEDRGEEVLGETLKTNATHENDRIVRAFTWWTNTQKEGYGSRVDVDLSLMAIKDDGERELVAYYNRSGPAVHSGDITDGGKYGGKGVCEFIDVNIDDCKELGYRYLVFTVNDYTGHKFSETPATFGWMEGRAKDIPGYLKHDRKLFDARSVQMNMKLTGENTRIIPAVFDIEKERMIWIDRSEKFVADRPNNIGAMQEMIDVSMERALDYEPLSMYDLAMIHAERRGDGFTSRLEEADTAFTMTRIDREMYPQIKDVVTPYDLDKIKNLSSLEPEKKGRTIDRTDERADRSPEQKELG